MAGFFFLTAEDVIVGLCFGQRHCWGQRVCYTVLASWRQWRFYHLLLQLGPNAGCAELWSAGGEGCTLCSTCAAPLGWAPTAAWACIPPQGLSFTVAFTLTCCQVVVSPLHPQSQNWWAVLERLASPKPPIPVLNSAVSLQALTLLCSPLRRRQS